MSQKHAKRRSIPRMKILRRDNFICGYCFENQATTVDHIMPVAYKDDPRETNLIACCTRCNTIAGDKVFSDVSAKREYITGVIASSRKWQKRRDFYVDIDIREPQKEVVVVEEKQDARKHPKVNDRPKPPTDVFSQSVVRESLRALVQHYGYDPDNVHVGELQEVANTLSGMVGKNPPWGWVYLRNVLNKKLQASSKLIDAIMRLGAMVDGMPKERAQGKAVEVLAMGNVRPGTVVFGDSRKCANPACELYFLPKSASHRYHDIKCRKAANALKHTNGKAHNGAKEG